MTRSRPYAGDQDRTAMAVFLAHARSEIHAVHHLHVGDLVWLLAHMQAGVEPATICRLWETADGALSGFVLLYPGAGFFDLEVHPEVRGSGVVDDMLHWAETQLRALTGAARTLSTLINEHDGRRRILLEAHGYTRGDPRVYLERSLTTPLPMVTSPPGFQVRALGPTEVDARAAVLAAAFEAPVHAERYAHLMATPGYDRALDTVAVDPDWSMRTSQASHYEPSSASGTGQIRRFSAGANRSQVYGMLWRRLQRQSHAAPRLCRLRPRTPIAPGAGRWCPARRTPG